MTEEELSSRDLLVCPCGKTPDRLVICESYSCKWAWVSGNCCSEWNVEFRTKYYKIDSPECMDLAIREWNSAPRQTNEGD